MTGDHFARFFPAVCAGFGLFLAGSASLLLIRRGVAVKAAAVLAAFGVTLAAAWSLDQPGTTEATARLLALGFAPFLLLGSRWVMNGVAAVVAAAHRPAVRFGLLAGAGVVAVAGSMAVFEAEEEHAGSASMNQLELTQGQIPTVATESVRATTDRGNPVPLREPAPDLPPIDLGGAENKVLTSAQLNDHIMRRGPADDRTNCHGWVFTGGKYRVAGTEVELILKENGYQEVHEPQAGDLVIYRQAGQVTHTALVRYVTEGQPVLVESKWGNLGTFLHPADRSVYGTDYTFHRSPRKGHLLVGLGGAPAPTDAGMATVVE